ncbi:MAG: hypothetical protein A4S09_09355 [Proteobacteria bacterium SG_bin7]|nr:MAG: hypothetical protein A4S09_09355 [Proteobacteria bacterium SG_bin7]
MNPIFFLIFLFQILPLALFGKDVLVTDASIIIGAKTDSDLRNSLDLFQKLKTSNELCEKRVRNKEFPIACYQKLSLRKRLGNIGNNEIQNSLKFYDEICRKAEISGQIPNETDLTEVSLKCQTLVRLALCKKSYRDGLVRDCELSW